MGWGGEVSPGEGDGEKARGSHAEWVRELMVEEGVRALPRSMETLGRCYDARDFWERIGISPVRARI